METEVGYSFDLLARVEGIFLDISGLSSDLIHPSDSGTIGIGRNLAGKLTETTGT